MDGLEKLYCGIRSMYYFPFSKRDGKVDNNRFLKVFPGLLELSWYLYF